MRVRAGQRRRGVGQVADLGVDAGVLGDGQCLPETGQLLVRFRPFGLVGHGEVREARPRAAALVLVVHGLAHRGESQIEAGAVAAEAGVDFEVDPRGPFFTRRRDDPFQSQPDAATSMPAATAAPKSLPRVAARPGIGASIPAARSWSASEMSATPSQWPPR